MRQASVYFNGTLAGTLEEHGSEYVFQYLPEYVAGGLPIGFTLPIQNEPFRFDGLPPLFENLVAEGWMKGVQAQEQKIDSEDKFGLLMANGTDLVGAITVTAAAQ